MNPPEVDDVIVTAEPKVELVPTDDPTAATIIFRQEDHTMGNLMRYVLIKQREVEFAGYAIPHPLEAKMTLRVQTRNGVPVRDVVAKALADIKSMSGSLANKFTDGLDRYQDKMDLD